MRFLCVAGFAALAACAASDRASPTDVTIAPIDGPVVLECDDWSRPDWLLVTRVVDALTGEPLTGARIHHCHERDQPPGGVFFDDGTWRADEFGFVRVPPCRQRADWFFVEQDGYGPIAAMGYLPSVVQLMPGVDLPVRVVDPLDRPIADAEVGLCLGCGHTPDVRVATADASGAAVVHCVETTARVIEESGIRDLYPRAAGFSGCYSGVKWRLGDPPKVLRPDFVPAVRGRVVSPTGVPLGGVAIGDRVLHRGPWTWSAADGTFCHIGREERNRELCVFAFGREYSLRPPAIDCPIEVLLPAAAPRQRALGRLRVTVRDGATGDAIANAVVDVWLPGLVHPGDPTGSEITDAHGVCLAPVPAGIVEVRVTDGASVPTFDTEVATFEVDPDAERDVTIRVARRVLRPIAVVEPWRDVVLVTASETVSLANSIREGAAVPLPAQGPFALVLHQLRESERRFVFASVPAGPLALRPFSPTRVRLRILDGHGQPVAARAALVTQAGQTPEEEEWYAAGADGAVVVPAEAVGCAFLRVEPLAAGVRSRTMHVSLPARGDDVVQELGDVTLPSADRPQLRIVGPDGVPARGGLLVLRPGLRAKGTIADDGGFDGLDLVPGDRLVHENESERRFTTRWSGQASWTLPDDRGEVQFEVVDAAGLQPLECVLLFGDRVVNEHEGALVLEAVPAGDVEIFVGARGCHSARVTLRLEPGERRNVRVALRRA